MKIIRLALDVLLNDITEHTRDLAYAISDDYANDHDWILYLRGCVDPDATRELIIEETYYGILRTILTWFKRH